MASTQMLSRAHGVLLGQLAGDALGSYVEFETPTEIRRRHPEGVTMLRPGGTWGLLAGQPTDDSEMALALARCLVASGGFDAEAVAARYVAWGASKPFDIGTTTRAGLAALTGRGRPAAGSQSNGALMRVSPIGILAAGRPELAAELAGQDAALTHRNPVCVAASGAFAAAIAAGIAGADHRTMWSVAYAQAGDDAGGLAVRGCLLTAMQAAPADLVHQQGWVLLALGNAFHRLGTGQQLASAVIETVAAGGDTDTNAAICGALLGAAQGREAVPLAWRRQVLACRAVQGDGVRHPRPAEYWGDDALDLAEALLATGADSA
jgi:ADP-ribosylglycohydrolase